MLHVVLYHRGQAKTEPRKIMPLYAKRPVHHSNMEAIAARYVATRRVSSRPGTVKKIDLTLHQFMNWLDTTHPHVSSWTAVTREHLLEFAEALETMPGITTGHPLNTLSRRGSSLISLCSFVMS